MEVFRLTDTSDQILEKVAQNQSERNEVAAEFRQEFSDELHNLLRVKVSPPATLRFLFALVAFSIFIVTVFIFNDVFPIEGWEGLSFLLFMIVFALLGRWVAESWRAIANTEWRKSSLIWDEVLWLLDEKNKTIAQMRAEQEEPNTKTEPEP